MSARGNVFSIRSELTSFQGFIDTLNWIINSLTKLLIVQIGIYIDIDEIDCKINSQEVSIVYPKESFSIQFANLTGISLEKILVKTLNSVKQSSSSYERYITSISYLRQALLLVSSEEVNYIPYSASSEVFLNLTKCIENLFKTSDRDDLRRIFNDLGFSPDQIESQLIPITLIRNEMDVGHVCTGNIDSEEITILRDYMNRSIKNVISLLQVVERRILENDLYLDK